MRTRPHLTMRVKRPETPKKLFTQVIQAAQPAILKLWEEGDRFFPKEGTRCEEEIQHEKVIGRSYYQCNPHFWQCYWQKGIKEIPSLEVEVFGQVFHIVAKPSFESRYYGLYHKKSPHLPLTYGYLVDMEVKEIPGISQVMILKDSCRDTYLPQRIYGYKKHEKGGTDFTWDNFDRNIFIDKFYVTNRQVNEWRILTKITDKIENDRKKWPLPAHLSLKDQHAYCAFYGKRLLEAKLFDAATMTPADFENPLATKVLRPATPWQRDIGKTFLGMARINPEYELTPLDCQLAQVQGCPERYFTTDSATWMGFHFGLGFYPESLQNFIEPKKNLKYSSKLLPAASPWHELGLRGEWNSNQESVAFRCYEEVIP